MLVDFTLTDTRVYILDGRSKGFRTIDQPSKIEIVHFHLCEMFCQNY